MGANAQTTVPTFTTGQVLTAAQMNQSARTGVPVFANTTDRDAAFGGAGEKTLAEGQLCYLEDTNATQFYDGSTWSTIGGGSTMALKWKSGGIYLPPNRWNNSITAANQTTYYIPLFTPETVTLDRIICHTQSTFSGTASVRLGIFSVASATGLPGNLILDAGTVSCTAATTQYTITISQSVSAGMFYLAFNSQTNAATNAFYSYNNTSSPEYVSFYEPRSQSNSSITNLGQGYFHTQTGVSGAFGNASVNNSSGLCPTIAVRVA